MSTNREELSKEELELHQIMLSRTRLKSSMRTSTLMAGFALVRTDVALSVITSQYRSDSVCLA